MIKRRTLIAASLAIALPARADTWPSKPIKLIVPYAPGGTTDVVARMVAEYLGKRLGQNIIVDNRPGKGAMIGTALVAKSPPDFIHISIASRNPSVLVVNPDFKAKTFQEYVAIARAEPGKLIYATSGAGSSNHLLGAQLSQVIGAEMVHVPYRGAGPAMIDTINGTVPSMFDSLPSAAPHIQAGKVRALAVSSEERSPTFPDIPTMKELGYPDVISYSWFGISVPAKTPQPIVDKLATEMQAVLKEPAVVKRWQEIGAEGSTMTPAEVTKFIQSEIDKWTPVVKSTGAKPE